MLILITVAFGQGSQAAQVKHVNQNASGQDDNAAANSESHRWTFLRGNDFDGHSAETGIADAWPSKGPPVLWHRNLGVGYSGFVGQRGLIYTQYQNLTGQYIVCLDAKTGDTIWQHKYDWPYQPASLYPGPRSTPTLYGSRVFVTSPTATIFCFDADTGERIWQADLAKMFGAPEVEFGYACSPVCYGEMILLPVGGKDASMVALDPTDGTVIWNSGNAPISYCSAYPIRFENRAIVVGYFKNKLSLFDQQTGKQLGGVRVSVDYDEHSAWPIYCEPFLWVSGPFRTGSRLYKLVNETSDPDKIRLTQVYSTKAMSNDVASSVLWKDHLYGFDLRDVQSKVHRPSRGQFTCMDFMTGEIRWQNGTIRRRKLQNAFDVIDETMASDSVTADTDIGHASVIVADGKLLMLNDTGELILGRADAESFQPLSRTPILGGEICWMQPLLLDGCLFARNHSKGVCVFLGDAQNLEKASDELQFASDIHQPIYTDWASLILGTEPTYAMTAPKPKWLIQWFFVSLALGWTIAPVVGLIVHRFSNLLPARTIFLTSALAMGLLGTTLVGHWLKQFYFSWPISLAVLFEVLVCQLKSNDPAVKPRPLLARLMLVLFVAVCVGFFVLCRRLSLPFEWTFLLGFPAAVPFLLIVKRSVQRGEPFSFKQWGLSLLSFTAFYWLGAGVMIWKYAA